MRTTLLTLMLLFSFNLVTPELPYTNNTALIETVHAQDSVERSVEVETAADMPDGSIEIPQWVDGFVLVLRDIPYVGPYVLAIIKYASIISAILTMLSSLLMGISGILSKITKESSPSWMKKAKSWLDKFIDISKYLSMFNVQKKK